MLSSIKLLFSTYETYLKIAVILIYTAIIWYCHTVYDKSKLEVTESKQLVQATNTQTNIVQFHQQLKKVYVKVKEPCLNTDIPNDINQLLK